MNFYLECLGCQQRSEPTVRNISCEKCGELFHIQYSETGNGVSPRLPLLDGVTASLGEGGTPLISLRKTAEALGLGQLWAKLEYFSPTGSFKDRGTAVLISAALAEGVTEFVEDSSGNAGASLSAYAAAAGMKAHVFVPSSAASGKLDQIRIFGAELHAIDGPRQAATDAAVKFVEQRGLPYLSHNLSPYFSEGMKSFAYELVESEAINASHVVLPVGNGSLLIGAKNGFDELEYSRKISSTPRFHAVQVDAVRPIEAAINGIGWDSAQAGATVASGIAVTDPPRLAQCSEAVRSSRGTSVAVSDEATLEWQRRLAHDEGIFCEATSAAAFAGLERAMANGAIGQGESVIVPITGSGLKEPVRK